MGEYVVQYPLKVLLDNAINGSGEPMNPPAGLYLTRGDGVAVEVTAEMIARHRWERHVPWDRIHEASREHETECAQIDLDALVAGLLKQIEDPSNG